jgi:hypothetical protein
MHANGNRYQTSWNDFIVELEEKILPVYVQHERDFDPWSVHGRMHICRSVLFSEYMARFYRETLSAEVDLYAVRVATALHDSGRRANGADRWEKESQTNCLAYIKSSGSRPEHADYPAYVAGLIEKQQTGELAKQIVYDADVIEIMRPCCGHGGIEGFKREFLHFLGSRDVLARDLPDASRLREMFIQEAWRWINETERFKLRLFKSLNYMQSLLETLEGERQQYPLLSSLL